MQLLLYIGEVVPEGKIFFANTASFAGRLMADVPYPCPGLSAFVGAIFLLSWVSPQVDPTEEFSEYDTC